MQSIINCLLRDSTNWVRFRLGYTIPWTKKQGGGKQTKPSQTSVLKLHLEPGISLISFSLAKQNKTHNNRNCYEKWKAKEIIEAIHDHTFYTLYPLQV